VAAAGGHALLFTGPPGTGKTLLARALVGLLPPPSFEERLAITRVLSAAGRWPGGLARRRPFRAPHHTVSFAGLVGGGAPPSPGEITLAHGGVLFLDELPEFRREALEALRQPLESGAITISRAGKQLELPARFQLVAAMNPCPCGYLGHPRIPCKCDPGSLARYRAHISGPLYDRIDLRVEVPPPSVDELALDGRRARADGTGGTGGTGGPQPDDATAPSAEGRALARRAPFGPRGSELAATVAAARERARERQGERFNAALSADELDRWMPLDGPARRLVEVAAEKRGLSARAVQSVRRVARTCADLEHSSAVEARHVAQALALRA
jgi:magnesium chelatase family protein